MKSKAFKRITLSLLGAVLTGMLAGCGGLDVTSTLSPQMSGEVQGNRADLLKTVLDTETIVFAMEGQWAPWTYHDDDDKLVGYDKELGDAIAQKLGVKAEYVEGEWDTLFSGLDEGRYDAIINGITITPERMERYSFSTPYAYDYTALAVKSSNNTISDFEDLKGIRAAASFGSVYSDIVASYGAEIIYVDTIAESIKNVVLDKSDAVVNSLSSLNDYMMQYPDTPIKVVAVTDEPTEIAICLRKEAQSESLIEAINKAISELSEDGTLRGLSRKYFGTDHSLSRKMIQTD